VGSGTFSASDIFRGEGSPAQATPVNQSLARDAALNDTGNNAVDFSVMEVPTPGRATGSCADACSSGATSCVAGVLSRCVPGTSGCLEWSQTPCESGLCADDTTCSAACQNDDECDEGKACDHVTHACITDPCIGVTCSDNGTCAAVDGAAVCNCNAGYKPQGTECVVNPEVPESCWIQWYGSEPDGRTIDVDLGATAPATRIYTQVVIPGITEQPTAGALVRSQLGYATVTPTYPVIAADYTWTDAAFNSTCTACVGSHEYSVDFPTAEAGDFKFITRFSIDGGQTWSYCQGPDTKKIIDRNPVNWGAATVRDPALCSPTCASWQGCSAEGVCVPRKGRCATNDDCSAGNKKKCDVPTNRCVDHLRGTPTFDGVVNEEDGDWSSLQLLGMTTSASNWGSSNWLSKLYVAYDDSMLYVGVVGSVPNVCAPDNNNAIVLFLDIDYGGSNGRTDLSEPDAGSYCVAGLNDAITRPYFFADALFKPDYAVGTCRMMDVDDESSPPHYSGWRRTSDYSDVGGAVKTGWNSFEAMVPYHPGLPTNLTMGIVGRLGRIEGDAASNQTLPEDDPSNPTTIRKVATFTFKPQ